MHNFARPLIISTALLAGASFAHAEAFSVTSDDIAHGEFMKKAHEFQGFGCSGNNQPPHLSWKSAPEGTKAFAVMAYDPDAPTGSGWWHWQVVNIPATVSTLPAGAGDASQKNLPEGSRQLKNDYGVNAFGGACPPEGHGAHRYQFTVYALSQVLELPEDPSGALTGYMVKAHALGSATLESLYKR